VALAATVVAASVAVRVEAAPPSAAAVKAVFLYKIAKFVHWPDSAFAAADTPLTICVVGEDPFGPYLDALAGRQVGNRTVAVRRLRRLPDGDEPCHLLFVSSSEGGTLADLLARTRGRPTLTVSDIDGFAEAGGVVGLATRDHRLRFAINVATAHAAGLRIEPQLLTLATVVSGGAP